VQVNERFYGGPYLRGTGTVRVWRPSPKGCGQRLISPWTEEFPVDQQLSLYPSVTETTTPVVTQTVVITEKVEVSPSRPASYLIKPDSVWGWQELRDYVVAQIEALFGPSPRDLRKEKSIFSSFIDRFGTDAPRIARYAFESPATKGLWGNAPIRVTRFTRASDEWFAVPILDRLQKVTV
jgi:hypothetical protein